MNRPEFDEIQDYTEFCKYYWYRDELIRICKAHGLKAPSSKTELYQVIEAYFSGVRILPDKKVSGRKKKPVINELTLETGLIECGFTFGNRFRKFFSEQTGEEHFKFHVDMVATVKAVRENDDEAFTLGDLLDVYYGRKTYARYDKSALQWNQFVKDFCSDESTKIFSKRLKAAAALWKIVRESDMKKEYSHELFEKHREYLEATQRDGPFVLPENKRKERNQMIKVYCYSRCSTCKKALKWLEENHIGHEVIDIVEDHPDEKTLREYHAVSGLPLKRFFNTSGMQYRALELSKKLPDMSEDEQFALLASDGMLVKRPMVVGDGFVLTGFKENEWAEKLC